MQSRVRIPVPTRMHSKLYLPNELLLVSWAAFEDLSEVRGTPLPLHGHLHDRGHRVFAAHVLHASQGQSFPSRLAWRLEKAGFEKRSEIVFAHLLSF